VSVRLQVQQPAFLRGAGDARRSQCLSNHPIASNGNSSPPLHLGRQSTVLMRNKRTNLFISFIVTEASPADATVTREESWHRFLLARQIVPDGVSCCRSILPSICRKNSTILFDLLLALHVTTPLEMLGGGFP
jgi:hypothetical protein